MHYKFAVCTGFAFGNKFDLIKINQLLRGHEQHDQGERSAGEYDQQRNETESVDDGRSQHPFATDPRVSVEPLAPLVDRRYARVQSIQKVRQRLIGGAVRRPIGVGSVPGGRRVQLSELAVGVRRRRRRFQRQQSRQSIAN